MGCALHIEDKDALKEKLAPYETGGWVAEEKLDGQWAQVLIVKGVVQKIVSRNGKEKNFIPLLQYKFPEWLTGILIGEISYGTSSPKFKDKIALFYDWAELETPAIEFGLPGATIRTYETFDTASRRKELESLNFWNDKVGLVERRTTGFYDFYKEIIGSGGEGIILKRLNSMYFPGTRSKDYIKVKKMCDVDMVVMGIGMRTAKDMSELTKSKGQADWIREIHCGQYRNGKLVEEVSVGSMTEAARGWFTQNKEAAIGSIVVIRGYGQFEKTGAIRHPFLYVDPDGKFLRDDITQIDCQYGKIKII